MGLFDLNLLTQLTLTPGLPGREQRVAGLIKGNISSAWQVNQDKPGNLIAHLPGNGKATLLIAHMDEVGLIVQRITQDGFLKVERMGGMSLRSLPGSQLDLWTDDGGLLPAQAGVMPQHLDEGLTLEWKNIYIDIGARSRSEAQRWGVRIDNGLTWSAPMRKFGDNCIRGKGVTYVPDADLAHKIQSVAQDNNIPLQDEVISGLSTALAPLPVVSKGVKTAALSIPIRYHHSPIETADMADASLLYELLLKFLTTSRA